MHEENREVQLVPATSQATREAISENMPTEEEELIDSLLVPPEELEGRRVARRPSIDHLEFGVGLTEDETDLVPLFATGDRIVVDRRTFHLKCNPWLDTRVYIVKAIDTESGAVSCVDEDMGHTAILCFKNPLQEFRVAPKHGNPFRKSDVRKQPFHDEEQQPRVKRGRGRPKGALNRPKDVIQAEKRARLEAKKLKRAKHS